MLKATCKTHQVQDASGGALVVLPCRVEQQALAGLRSVGGVGMGKLGLLGLDIGGQGALVQRGVAEPEVLGGISELPETFSRSA